MSLPQIFSFENQEVRTIEHDGDIWFVAKDVAEVLGYKDTAYAITTHCKGVGETQTPTMGGIQTVKIIPERDVYRLVMRSKLPSAEKFENWVVSEVLPAIRKTGSYTAPLSPEMQMAHGLIAAQLMIEQKDATIAELAPKAAIADRIQGADGNMNIRNAAKALKVKEHEFVKWLQLNGWVFRNKRGRLEGYSSKVPRYVDHKVTPIPVDGDEDRVSLQVMITPEGLTKLAGIFNVELEKAA